MDKRTIVALGLIMVLIFVYQAYFIPKETQKQPPAQTQTQTEPLSKDQKNEIKETKKETQTQKAFPTKTESVSKVEKKIGRTFTAETPYLKVTLGDLGGGIISVKLKKYRETVKGTSSKELVEDIKPYVYIPQASLRPAAGASAASDATYFQADKESVTVKDKPETITLSGTLENGSKIKKTYTFYPDNYVIDVKIEPEAPTADTVYYDLALLDTKKESSLIFKGPLVYNGKLEQITKIDQTQQFERNYTYAGFDEGFFACLFIPEGNTKPQLSILKTENQIPVLRLGAEKGAFMGKLYFGPKQSSVLQSLNVHAEKIVYFGWFDIIAKPLILGLNLSNRVTHNYGIDIILLTILIKIIFYPLSVKSYKSMKKMQELQPLVKKLKEKYPNDKQKLNQEMMDIYRTRGVNPMGGCLPMIIQLPVFFALYKGLCGAIELRHAPFMLWINDLSAPEDLFSFPVAGWVIPVRILPLIMGVTQFIQQKMTPTAAVDPMQEKMMLLMPIVFTFIFWNFSSGLVLYWLVNNVISIGQQYYINKKVT
ncbi:MAG TPA: membrane protein insertase YidC [Syntrophorhabdaceae bacterium]|nr:membrane protein insertase YidC [Syntrophorhabdaceae bacterium]